MVFVTFRRILTPKPSQTIQILKILASPSQILANPSKYTKTLVVLSQNNNGMPKVQKCCGHHALCELVEEGIVGALQGTGLSRIDRLSSALLDIQKSSKGWFDGPEIRQSICLIVRTIKLTLSSTTSTQAVLCILHHTYRGAPHKFFTSTKPNVL